VKLLLDENLSQLHAAELRSRGADAIGAVEAGLGGAPDPEVRQFAVKTNRILVTLDADFANVIRFPPAGTPGVMRLKVHPPTEQKIREAIRRGLFLLENLDLKGKLAVVDDTKIRVRG
jgi:predicted nuclease of predicted toxin-antitoxin system